MQFAQLNIDPEVKQRLIESAKNGRIPHAQMFLGGEGTGALSLAIAYAQYINCENPGPEDSCGQCKSCRKFQNLTHPDLHFVFPVIKTPKNSKPYSADILEQWREFVSSSYFNSLEDWLSALGASDAQASIYVHEAEEIIKTLSYKAFEAKYKVMIIWLPEKMNISAANKLLKILEEPPDKTIFILVSENAEQILPTIKSRTQIVKLPPLSPELLEKALKQEFPDAPDDLIAQAAKAADGNFITAKKYLRELIDPSLATPFFDLFVKFMRTAYAGKPLEMINFVEELSSLGREKQKQFLRYSLHFLRQAFMINQNLEKITHLTEKERNFAQKFSPFITKNNIENLNFEFSKAYSDIERNA
jgi:DNA polymerase-3 subunit delta'